MIHLVTYDLRRPGQTYDAIHERIRSLGDWWHYLESTWMIHTDLRASEISAHLRSVIDANDLLLVAEVTADNDGWLPPEAWTWINQRIHVSYAHVRALRHA
jgi:hypothetical protein